MNIFKRILNYSHNRKLIRQIINPFFKSTKNDLNQIKIIEINNVSDVLHACEKLKESKSKKNENIIQECDVIFQQIKTHNSLVEEINKAVESFDYQSVIDNPYSLDYQSIEYHESIVKKIQSFKMYTDFYYEYVDHIHILYESYSELVEEYNLKKNFDSLGNLDIYDFYLDSKTTENLYSNRRTIKKKVDAHKRLFYSWESDASFADRIEEKNQEFISRKMDLPLFDSINGRSLDKDQRVAVLTNETSTLVIAGAGSGKTLTICGKVQYLLNELHVDPKDILLLSYSKKSADDLQKKVSKINPELTVGTFHKLGLDILKETQNKTFAIEEQYKAIIESYFRKEVVHRPKMLKKILTYYGLFLNYKDDEKKYKDEGERYADLKNMDFTTLKDCLLSISGDKEKRKTIKKEFVKSYEELAIANWYFINGIEYRYEKPYEKDVSTPDHRQYLPDFTLTQYHIYHEHYGIDKLGQAKQYDKEDAEKYRDVMEWKRDLHEAYHTLCIETYSYEFEEGTIFRKLEKVLKDHGVVFHPLTNEQIFNAVESIYQGQSFRSFINLISTFLSLYKATYSDNGKFEELKNSSNLLPWRKMRTSMFIDIVKDIYDYYMDYIRKEDKIDFDDMILKSTSELDQTDHYRYKYIIVDEFQDISVSRMRFLRKLIEHGNAKLFAAGDDWQAIYRFSGCDLNIFLHFSDYFGFSKVTKISTTHRNSQELQDVASAFIKKNNEQIKKVIHSDKHLDKPIKIKFYDEHKHIAFLDVVSDIYQKDSSAHVLILGRNNKDFDSIAMDKRIYIDYKHKTETKIPVVVSDYPDMTFSYSTAHGSKGLEEDYVIIINGNDSRLGFPNKMEDDELLDMVLSSKSEFPYAEERRLWYVALTRARLYTYILADQYEPSEFVKEIEDQCDIMDYDVLGNIGDEISCPHCKSGRLVLRESPDGHKFYGCSNYPYCNYTISDLKAVEDNLRCPECGDFLVLKIGRYGKFYGCHSYRNGCRYTERVDED